MTLLSGDVISVNRLDPMLHAVGSPVFVMHDRKTIAAGVVDDHDTFEIALPPDLVGEIEVRLGKRDAAAVLVKVEGEDVHVTLWHNNVNNFLA